MNDPIGKEPEHPRDQHAGTVATENPAGGRSGERHEVGTASSSRRDPPHRTENDEEAAAPERHHQADAPALPANAAGSDSVPAEEHDKDVDEASAYDRRSSQHKDNPPSKR